MSSQRHLKQLARIALLVAAGDLVTKAAAKYFLADAPTTFAPWLQLAIVHNNGGAFGWSLGGYTWHLNLALTLCAIAFMVPVTRDLARIDPAAPRALGLIVGGAFGNLASMLTSPQGVVDFIAVPGASGGQLVLNVADVAAYVGLAMILRTGGLIVLQIRRGRPAVPGSRRIPVRAVFPEKALLTGQLAARPLPADAEVAVVDWSDVTHPAVVLADAPEPARPMSIDAPPSAPVISWEEVRARVPRARDEAGPMI